jgi:hypothetical protein
MGRGRAVRGRTPASAGIFEERRMARDLGDYQVLSVGVDELRGLLVQQLAAAELLIAVGERGIITGPVGIFEALKAITAAATATRAAGVTAPAGGAPAALPAT